MPKIPFSDKMPIIRAELVRLARAGQKITYGQLGEIVGMPAQGPWKPVLDDIGREETAAGRPDFTYLVVSKQTGFPGQIGFELAKPLTDTQRKHAGEVIASVFEYYSSLSAD